MANIPKDLAACGCGMIGEYEGIPSSFKLRKFRIIASNSDRVHEGESWWCKECRRSEWRCLSSGKGRFCEPDS